MNRRTFLRSIAAVCGTAVVCPGELVKSPITPAVGVGERAKHIVMGDHPVFHNILIKARQQGCTNSTLAWKNFYADHNYSQKYKDQLLKEFETAFWDTKFKSPLMKGIGEPY